VDEAGFRQSLKRAGKAGHVIDALVSQVRAFEDFLCSQRGAGLEQAAEADLRTYLGRFSPDQGRVGVRGLGLYFAFTGKRNLADAANAFRQERVVALRQPEKLSSFRGVSGETAARLKAIGIANTQDMLAAGGTPAARQRLSEQTGIAPEAILELVELSDLARLEGVKGIRARLYYDAGLDTLDKLAACEAAELRRRLVDWVARTGFQGIAPLPKELENTIASARSLPRVVEY